MADAPTANEAKIKHKFGTLDAHHRLFIAAAVAAGCCALLPSSMAWATRILGTWNAYVYTVLGLIWTTILTAEPKKVVSNAKLEDNSRAMIFVFVIVAACASVFVVPLELGTAKGLDRLHANEHVAFAILTVLASWVLVHTVFTLRYAHIYYDTDENHKQQGGLNFPDEPEPDYLDFAYFSFVIGMTSQVSDVTISSSPIRRLALVHGLIAFAFNVAIIGLSINTISGLFSG